MSASPQPTQNHLLAALASQELKRLAPHLEWVVLELGEVLYEPGDTLRHVYFPTDSIVSLLHVTESGASAEIAVVGNEGLVGIAVLIAPEWIDEVSWRDHTVSLDLKRATIRTSPHYESSEQLNREREATLFDHYERIGYWHIEAVIERLE